MALKSDSEESRQETSVATEAVNDEGCSQDLVSGSKLASNREVDRSPTPSSSRTAQDYSADLVEYVKHHEPVTLAQLLHAFDHKPGVSAVARELTLSGRLDLDREWNLRLPSETPTQVAHPVCPQCSTPTELGMCDLWFCPVSGCTASNVQKGGK